MPSLYRRCERPIALVGLMGVGKTTVGRRLAKRLGLDFYDSDDEIEAASGRTVAGYFKDHGEAAFREGERRVIDRSHTNARAQTHTNAARAHRTRECAQAPTSTSV